MKIIWAEKQGQLWVILAMDEQGELEEFAGKTFPAAARIMNNHQVEQPQQGKAA
jgi:hypothetical protein